ncbi:MAG: N-glycosylase/DNA lyase [Candidatus Aenigmatarchaeota archaeon]
MEYYGYIEKMVVLGNSCCCSSCCFDWSRLSTSFLTSTDLSRLIESYKLKKRKIRERIKEFRKNFYKSNKKIFSELAFCICTPQSKAEICDERIKKIEKNGILFNGNKEEIASYLSGIRFPRKKAEYIVKSRELFERGGKIRIKERIKEIGDAKKIREWLVENVFGIGYKEASHFLRNIGLGKDMAILDRHILKSLKSIGIIEEIPKSLTKKKYLKIERKMEVFSKKIKIPMDELDLLLWSENTGKIFK